jgi:hypothetical protein
MEFVCFVFFRMRLAELMLVAVLATATALGMAPQPYNSEDAGTACRCTSSLTELGIHVCDLDCSSRNISVLSTELQISQEVRSLDLSRNLLSSLTNGKSRSNLVSSSPSLTEMCVTHGRQTEPTAQDLRFARRRL